MDEQLEHISLWFLLRYLSSFVYVVHCQAIAYYALLLAIGLPICYHPNHMTAYTIPHPQTISQDVAARKAARRKIIESTETRTGQLQSHDAEKTPVAGKECYHLLITVRTDALIPFCISFIPAKGSYT